jgi:hypothetical protein
MAWRGVFAVVFCGVWVIGGTREPLSAQTAPGGQGIACGADLVKSLAGAWKAPEYRMKRASEVGTQVFGPNAFDVRNVALTLEPSGEGVLKISTSVLDQKGKTWAPTLIEAKVTVTAPQAAQAPGTGKCEPAVTVAGVEERYLDDSNYHTSLDGSRVILATDPGAKQIDVRFETPKGAGSFWSTLVRQAAPGAQRSQRPRPSQPVQ